MPERELSLFVNACMSFISSASIVFTCVLFLHVCVLGPTHPVKNGYIKPGPRIHCASYSRFDFVCWSQAVSVREGAPEELSGVMVRLVRPTAFFPYVREGVRLQLLPVLVFHGYPKGFPPVSQGEALLADSCGPKLLFWRIEAMALTWICLRPACRSRILGNPTLEKLSEVANT